MRMKERHIVEGDILGRYRVKPPPKKKERWVSPEIEKLLREGGAQADLENADAAPDEPDEQL
jgi:hypothetical protein